MSLRSIRWMPAVVTLIVLVTASSGLSGWQQQSPPVPFIPQDLKQEDTDRERYQRATDLLKALEISKGDWVADVGAGNGYYVQRMADLVGPTGKVFAEDIADHSIEWLHQRVKAYDLRNVEVVKGDIGDPTLPADSLAVVLVVNTYHHFQQYHLMLEQIFRALKPGGRLVIADYSLPSHRTESRIDQIKNHEIDPRLVRAEVGRVGFQVLEFQDPFLKRMPEVTTGDRIGVADMWLMIAVRPLPSLPHLGP
jgi:ubiquinone/menaquinone biosynthesis C-methylase UbiE